MRTTKSIAAFALLLLLLFSKLAHAQSITDYLILQDIGDYKFKTQTKDFITGQPRTIPGYSTRTAPGFLAGADHFDVDHDDKTYETKYVNRTIGLGVEVQITQHAGSESDKWLLHEVEDGYRDEDNLNATVDTNVQMRSISGKNIYFIGIYGAKSYAWISNNYIVVKIGCSNCPNTKPEPLEIVQAYLQKFPSTITLTDSDFKSRSHSEQWIKDEMDRRLWLADKWVSQITAADPKLYDKLDDVVKHLKVFLDYKGKYFVQTEEEKTAGITAKSEKNVLGGYLEAKDLESIKTKLAAYKAWWEAHKGDTINLQ